MPRAEEDGHGHDERGHDERGHDEHGGPSPAGAALLRPCATWALLPLLLTASTAIACVPAVVLRDRFEKITPCIILVLVWVGHLQLIPTATVRAAGKGARPFVRLNRGSAARFALSMGLGYAYGTLEGALLVLVCNGSGRVDGYLTILIATVIAAMNFSLRFEESLGRYGLAVSANVMLVRRRLQ